MSNFGDQIVRTLFLNIRSNLEIIAGTWSNIEGWIVTSSGHQPGGHPNYVIDFHKPNPSLSNCYKSSTNVDSWLQVFLNGTYEVHAIIVHLITHPDDAAESDINRNEFTNVWAGVGLEDRTMTDHMQCNFYGSTAPTGDSVTFQCQFPIYGNYISLKKDTGTLGLCEIEVIGVKRFIGKKLYYFTLL